MKYRNMKVVVTLKYRNVPRHSLCLTLGNLDYSLDSKTRELYQVDLGRMVHDGSILQQES